MTGKKCANIRQTSRKDCVQKNMNAQVEWFHMEEGELCKDHNIYTKNSNVQRQYLFNFYNKRSFEKLPPHQRELNELMVLPSRLDFNVISRHLGFLSDPLNYTLLAALSSMNLVKLERPSTIIHNRQSCSILLSKLFPTARLQRWVRGENVKSDNTTALYVFNMTSSQASPKLSPTLPTINQNDSVLLELATADLVGLLEEISAFVPFFNDVALMVPSFVNVTVCDVIYVLLRGYRLQLHRLLNFRNPVYELISDETSTYYTRLVESAGSFLLNSAFDYFKLRKPYLEAVTSLVRGNATQKEVVFGDQQQQLDELRVYNRKYTEKVCHDISKTMFKTFST